MIATPKQDSGKANPSNSRALSKGVSTLSDVADTGQIQLVTFRVANVLLGIDIDYVQEINRLMDVTPVPEASSMIHGVVNLRGDVVTVLNPHQILDLPKPTDRAKGRNLILKIDGERVGVLVDSVSDIVSVNRSEFSPRPTNVRAIDRRFIESVVLRESELIVILNPVGLVSAVND